MDTIHEGAERILKSAQEAEDACPKITVEEFYQRPCQP